MKNKKIPKPKTTEPKKPDKKLSYSMFPKKKTNVVPSTYRPPYND